MCGEGRGGSSDQGSGDCRLAAHPPLHNPCGCTPSAAAQRSRATSALPQQAPHPPTCLHADERQVGGRADQRAQAAGGQAAHGLLPQRQRLVVVGLLGVPAQSGRGGVCMCVRAVGWRGCAAGLGERRPPAAIALPPSLQGPLPHARPRHARSSPRTRRCCCKCPGARWCRWPGAAGPPTGPCTATPRPGWQSCAARSRPARRASGGAEQGVGRRRWRSPRHQRSVSLPGPHLPAAAAPRWPQPLTGLPFSPSWMRTLTMSMGWMRHVDSMPLAPPLTNGLAAAHTGLIAFLSDMVACAALRCAVRRLLEHGGRRGGSGGEARAQAAARAVSAAAPPRGRRAPAPPSRPWQHFRGSQASRTRPRGAICALGRVGVGGGWRCHCQRRA